MGTSQIYCDTGGSSQHTVLETEVLGVRKPAKLDNGMKLAQSASYIDYIFMYQHIYVSKNIPLGVVDTPSLMLFKQAGLPFIRLL